MRGPWFLVLSAAAASCTVVAGLDDLRFEDRAAGGSGGALTGGGGSGDGGDPPDLPSRFSDRSAPDFVAGSFEGTRVDGDQVTTDDGVSAGLFRSRVFDAQRPVRVTRVAWHPAAPYGKRMPRGADVETGYGDFGLDMGATILLLDFEELDGIVAGTEISNHALGGTPAAVVGNGAQLVPGRAGQGFGDTTSSQLEIPVADASPFQFGSGDFTWAYWFNSMQECPSENAPFGNRVHLGIEETLPDNTHLWLGCTSASPCLGAGGHLGGNLRMTTGEQRGFCGAATINDGEWHHLALVKSGHDGATLRLYVDGQLDLEMSNVELPGDATFAGTVPFFVGGFTEVVYQASGTFDDVLVATRAWSAAEVASAYGRHALGLTLRVRTCAEPDCADDPPFGELLRDDGPELEAPLTRDITTPQGRYVQYEVTLTTPGHFRPAFGEVVLEVEE